MSLRHFLSSDDLTVAEQAGMVSRAKELKTVRHLHEKSLTGQSIGLIFEKPSTRTRVSFEVAVHELGGHPVVLRADELQLGRGETLQDTSKVLSRYLSALVVRTFGQERLEELAETSTVPVINALSDLEHPCQALADVMTISERFGSLENVTLTYLGDGNNVCHSLLLAGAKAGLQEIRVACPTGFEPIEPIVEQARSIGEETGTSVQITDDPAAACKGSHVLYTDVWTSMGQEAEQAARRAAFGPFRLSPERLEEADPAAVVMHCLPAHRDQEISGEVIDGPASAVWDQAENRLHTQKSLLEMLCGKSRTATRRARK